MRKRQDYSSSALLALYGRQIDVLAALATRITDGQSIVLVPGSGGPGGGGTTPPIPTSGHVLYGSKHLAALAITAGAGLSVNYDNGHVIVAGTFYSIAAGNLAGLANGTTNYIFVNNAGTVASNTTGFPIDCAQLATAATAGGAVTGVTDSRAYIGNSHAAATLSGSASSNLLSLSAGAGGQQIGLNTQIATYVFAGPTFGNPAAVPSFRALITTDIPDLSSIYQPIFTAQAPNVVYAGPAAAPAAIPSFRALIAADVGTGAPTGSKYLRDDMSWQTPPGGGGAPHALLDGSVDNDTLAAGPALGAIIYANGTPLWARLAGNITATKQFLQQTGTGAISAIPQWNVIAETDMPGLVVTAGAGLSINYTAGHVLIDQAIYSVAAGSAGMANNATNRVYVDGTGTIQATTGAWPVDAIRLATVVTAGGVITGITDERAHLMGNGGVRYDSAWAATGDLIIGTGAGTAAKYSLSVPGGAALMNVFGVINGETTPTWKALFDATNPTTIVENDAPAPGTATIASHRDHKHGAPATWAPTSHNILSSFHADSTTHACVLGDLIIGQAGPTWARYAISVPAANVLNVLGVANAETGPTWKALFDATNPAAIGTAAPGTSLLASHEDHVHAAAHSALSGLSNDDHTQYALLAGRAGGQVLIGGLNASDTLTLQSTANATKGKILFGTSAYDEVNNYLGIGTASPSFPLVVFGTAYIETGLGIGTATPVANVGLKMGAFSTAVIWINTNTVASSKIVWGTSSDTNLYRSAAGVLKTDTGFLALGHVGIGAAAAINANYVLNIAETLSTSAAQVFSFNQIISFDSTYIGVPQYFGYRIQLTNITASGGNPTAALMYGFSFLSIHASALPMSVMSGFEWSPSSTAAATGGWSISKSVYGFKMNSPSWNAASGAPSTVRGLWLQNLGSSLHVGGDVIVGVDIEAQSGGSGTYAGIRNAAVTVMTPSTTQTLVAATAILANASAVMISAAGNITLTANPMIAAGQDGQELQVINVANVSITLNTNGMRYVGGGAAPTMVLNSTISFIYSATRSLWLEIGRAI